MKFFFDRNISPQIVQALRADTANEPTLRYQHQDDDSRFRRDSTDRDILTTLGTEVPLPVFVTFDLAQLKNPLTRSAFSTYKFIAVFVEDANHKRPVQIDKFRSIWPEVVEQCGRACGPQFFLLILGKSESTQPKLKRWSPRRPNQ